MSDTRSGLASNLGLAALLVVIWNQLRDYAEGLGRYWTGALLGALMGGGAVLAAM